MEWSDGPKQPEPPHDPRSPPLKDPIHDPAGDPTYEPHQPFGDPTPTPGGDPRPQNPEINALRPPDRRMPLALNSSQGGVAGNQVACWGLPAACRSDLSRLSVSQY
jgi:hypothetical protein